VQRDHLLQPNTRFVLCCLTIATALVASGCREDAVRVEKLTFEGVSSVDEKALRSVLATQQGSWIPFSKKPAFNQSAFDADLKRVTSFYADRGFPDARVGSVDVGLNDKKDAVRLTVHVIEGEPVRVADFQLKGFEQLSDADRNTIRNAVGLKPGDIRDKQRVIEGKETAINLLKERGYPYAKVETVEAPGQSPRTVMVTFLADAGVQATFGEVEIQGNRHIAENVIRRQLTFRPGQPFRLGAIQASQQRLRSIELFSFAYVEPRGGETQPAAVPVRVTVAEGPLQRVTFGVGYGTEDKARARVNWRHVNFLGDARTASAEAKWSSLDRGVKLGFAEPHLFTRHLSFSAQARAWDEHEPVYDTRTYGGRASVTWQRYRRNPVLRRGSTTSATVTFIDEYTQSTVADYALADPAFAQQLIALGLDPTTGSTSGTLVAMRVEALRNTAGQSLDPRRGYTLRIAFERAGGFLPGKYTYGEATAEGRAYIPLPGDVVFATRLLVAGIDAPEPVDASVPFFKRYFLGGSTSLRGWGRYQVSPTTTSGTPVGGLSMFEGSAELRIPITKTIGAVGFVDAGNVWADPWDINLGDLKADAGAGLRYNTKIGPIRADFGYQLTPTDALLSTGEIQTRHWRIHLSIGQAF
jgi:outer membrane protein insertion porin family